MRFDLKSARSSILNLKFRILLDSVSERAESHECWVQFRYIHLCLGTHKICLVLSNGQCQMIAKLFYSEKCVC